MIEAMSRAARAIVESLDGERAKMLMQPFDAAHVRDWHYVPRERRGLPLERASESQRARMWALVELGVSGEGVRKAHEITQLEGILGRIENRPDFRRPLNYALAIFGVPDTATPWGWRFEGHHLSLTFILDPASGLITTPVFFGANRQTVPRGHGHDGWRVLPAEEDMGFALINALDEKSRSEAIIADRSPGDIITGPGRERELKQPRGLAFVCDGHHIGASKRRQKLTARFDGLRRREHLANIRQRDPGKREQSFIHAANDLSHGPEGILEDNVETVAKRAGDEAVDGKHAVPGTPRRQSDGNVASGLARDELDVVTHASTMRLRGDVSLRVLPAAIRQATHGLVPVLLANQRQRFGYWAPYTPFLLAYLAFT